MDISNYKRTITELAQDLAKLEVYSKQLEMENTQVSLHELNEHIKNDRFNLAVLGEFRRGKSTLINALLRTPVLPSDIVPTTASVNRITYDPQPKVKVEYFDGATKDIDISELSDYATQEGEKNENVREITVWYPTVYCSNNVDIYDTPGLNDTEEMTKATMDVIDKMDVAIFTLSANVNFSASESEFLSEKLLTSNVGRVIFVITRMGEYTPEQQKRIIQSIRKGLEEKVMVKARDVFSDKPEELEAFQRKLGEVQIYGVDSVMALQARKNHDMELLEKSGYPAFERGIDDLLTRERGRVMLEKQTGAILKAANNIFNVIQTRMVPLTMDEDEFKTSCASAEKEIAAIQKRTKQEFDRLDAASQTILKNATEQWAAFVEEIKGKIHDIAAGLNVERKDLKRKESQAFTEEVWKTEMAPMLSHELQVYSEKMQNTVNEAIGKECKGLEAYIEEVSAHMDEIGMTLATKKDKTILAQNVGAVLANYFTLGAGNVYFGYKTAGVKGALVGGIAGTGLTVGSIAAISAVMATVGAVTWPVLVAGTLLGCFTGLVSGRAVVDRVFWKTTADKFRKDIEDAACKQFETILEESRFEEMLRDHITGTFSAIKAEITQTTLSSTDDLKAALQSTRENFAAEKAQVQQKLQTYESILVSLSSITDRTSDVRAAYSLDTLAETEKEDK